MWRSALILSLTLTFACAKADDLKLAHGVELVKAHCGACHSAQLVSQQRMSRSGWVTSIRYMQKNHNLWSLGDHEEALLDYLETHYGPASEARKRRANLPYN